MRIALFVTCYNDLLYPGVGRAIVRLLRRLGHEVECQMLDGSGAQAGSTCR